MGAGKRNVVAGFLGLIVFMLLGTYFEISLGGAGTPEERVAAKKGKSEVELVKEEDRHHLLVALHSHANIFCVLNVLIGLVLARAALGNGAKTAASWLAIAAMVFMPLGLVLMLATGVEPLAAISMLGGLCMIAATVITFVGLVKAPSEA